MEKNKIHNFINKESFVTSKKMGQNFLHSMAIKKRIVDSAKLQANDCVIEIGPGLGSITEIILNTNHPMLAIELDKRLYSFLVDKFSNDPNFRIINSMEKLINQLYQISVHQLNLYISSILLIIFIINLYKSLNTFITMLL